MNTSKILIVSDTLLIQECNIMSTKIKKYYERGVLPIKSINFDHVIPRVARKSPTGEVCRISLPKELDGKKVYVIVDMNGLNGD